MTARHLASSSDRVASGPPPTTGRIAPPRDTELRRRGQSSLRPWQVVLAAAAISSIGRDAQVALLGRRAGAPRTPSAPVRPGSSTSLCGFCDPSRRGRTHLRGEHTRPAVPSALPASVRVWAEAWGCRDAAGDGSGQALRRLAEGSWRRRPACGLSTYGRRLLATSAASYADHAQMTSSAATRCCRLPSSSRDRGGVT